MNIGFLNSARSWGGNERWMQMAAGELSGRHRVFLFFRSRVIGDRFSIQKFRLPMLSEADLLTIGLLVWKILTHRLDVLIPTKRKDIVLAGIAARMTRRFSVLRIGILRQYQPTIWNRIMYDWLADGIIVNARAIRVQLAGTGFIKPEKVRVIYNGLLMNEILQKASEPADPFTGFQVVSVGELSPRKGHDHAIRGFAAFLNRLPAEQRAHCRFAILGSGSALRSLEQLAESLGVADQVWFAGFLKNPYPIIRQSSVFLMVSNSEGLSNALLEAMALGTPVVSTDAGGGAAEILNHQKNGWLLMDPDEETIADGLFFLHNHPAQARTMAVEGTDTIRWKFDPERMGLEVAGFLSEIVTGTPPHA